MAEETGPDRTLANIVPAGPTVLIRAAGPCAPDSMQRLMGNLARCEPAIGPGMVFHVLLPGGFTAAHRARIEANEGVALVWQKSCLSPWLKPLSLVVAAEAFLLKVMSASALPRIFASLVEGNAAILLGCGVDHLDALLQDLERSPDSDPEAVITRDPRFVYCRYDEDLDDSFPHGGQWLACGVEAPACLQSVFSGHVLEDALA